MNALARPKGRRSYPRAALLRCTRISCRRFPFGSCGAAMDPAETHCFRERSARQPENPLGARFPKRSAAAIRRVFEHIAWRIPARRAHVVGRPSQVVRALATCWEARPTSGAATGRHVLRSADDALVATTAQHVTGEREQLPRVSRLLESPGSGTLARLSGNATGCDGHAIGGRGVRTG